LLHFNGKCLCLLGAHFPAVTLPERDATSIWSIWLSMFSAPALAALFVTNPALVMQDRAF
jgi:hypothetical protein